MARIINLINKDKIKTIFREGNVVALPTDTVFGLACIYDSKKAFDDLVKLKQRPSNKPFTLLFKNVEQVKKFCRLNKMEKKFLEDFFPGKVTILLRLKKEVPEHVDFNTGIVGVRIIKSKEFENLMDVLEKPILLTSCNVSGKPILKNISQIQKTFGKKLPFIFDLKIKMEDKPTTIVKFENNLVKIIREGSIPSKKILNFCKR